MFPTLTPQFSRQNQIQASNTFPNKANQQKNLFNPGLKKDTVSFGASVQQGFAHNIHASGAGGQPPRKPDDYNPFLPPDATDNFSSTESDDSAKPGTNRKKLRSDMVKVYDAEKGKYTSKAAISQRRRDRKVVFDEETGQWVQQAALRRRNNVVYDKITQRFVNKAQLAQNVLVVNPKTGKKITKNALANQKHYSQQVIDKKTGKKISKNALRLRQPAVDPVTLETITKGQLANKQHKRRKERQLLLTAPTVHNRPETPVNHWSERTFEIDGVLARNFRHRAPKGRVPYNEMARTLGIIEPLD